MTTHLCDLIKKDRNNSALAAVANVAAHKHHDLLGSSYFKKICQRDNQLQHDDKYNTARQIAKNAVNVGYVMMDGNTDVPEQSRILKFPAAMPFLKMQFTQNLVALKRGFIFTRSELKSSKINLAFKTPAQVKLAVTEILCELVGRLYQHILNIGSKEQAAEFEQTSLYRIFITPRVAQETLSDETSERVLTDIANSLDPRLCACLLSVLDSNNSSDYGNLLYEELIKYFKTANVNFKEVVDNFLNKYSSSGTNPILPVHNKNGTKTEYCDSDRKNVCLLIYIWCLLTAIAYAAPHKAALAPINQSRILRDNMAVQRDIDSAKKYNTLNHMLSGSMPHDKLLYYNRPAIESQNVFG